MCSSLKQTISDLETENNSIRADLESLSDVEKAIQGSSSMKCKT